MKCSAHSRLFYSRLFVGLQKHVSLYKRKKTKNKSFLFKNVDCFVQFTYHNSTSPLHPM